MPADRLVSVVVPAYNAEATLDETLRSVRNQTHRALEILVVDDGSDDGTARIVRDHAAADPRVVLVEQENAGVAAARNNGWRRARSDLIAFVDADDVWAPIKISRQLAALDRAGPRVGLVYCWYQLIDADGRIIEADHKPDYRGDVLRDLFQGNFVGNGSAALVRRQALIDANGFEPAMRAADAGGCEDILFYCRVAEHHEFEVVEEALLGYRVLPNNMSSNLLRMARSWLMMVDEMLGRHPDCRRELRRGLYEYSAWLFRQSLRRRQADHARGVLQLLVDRDPMVAAELIARLGPGYAVKLVRKSVQLVLPRRRPPPSEPVFFGSDRIEPAGALEPLTPLRSDRA
ncbi:glycosyltransferase family 2 protein [Sphingomonas ginkgonis]|uniref:Glycosyltransferase family 2 protein n=1 Tax=Sphingomonas ginkgonis TaxID=2315330 RepID=A0A3R9Y6T0_9SPHN|nr:glycosyltransferase family 2 protein [Sphingomonas ginkgonis]RST31398.1 glycosyltransferase family 2 protein [Sphingomonas ginkgonis]